jgi:hypothetical protein
MREMIGTIVERKRMVAPFLSPRGHHRRGQASRVLPYLDTEIDDDRDLDLSIDRSFDKFLLICFQDLWTRKKKNPCKKRWIDRAEPIAGLGMMMWQEREKAFGMDREKWPLAQPTTPFPSLHIAQVTPFPLFPRMNSPDTTNPALLSFFLIEWTIAPMPMNSMI